MRPARQLRLSHLQAVNLISPTIEVLKWSVASRLRTSARESAQSTRPHQSPPQRSPRHPHLSTYPPCPSFSTTAAPAPRKWRHRSGSAPLALPLAPRRPNTTGGQLTASSKSGKTETASRSISSSGWTLIRRRGSGTNRRGSRVFTSTLSF